MSQWYTSVMDFTGDHSKVRLSMSFRLQCEKDYYGDNCTVLCVAQDDNVTGHYLCNSDGSVQCLPGFENPENHCKDGQFAVHVHIILYLVHVEIGRFACKFSFCKGSPVS